MRVLTLFDSVSRAPIAIIYLEDSSQLEGGPTSDSMNHILSECRSLGQGIVWGLVASLWRNATGEHLPPQDVYTVLGCPLVELPASRPQSQGLSRLRKLIIVEAAYLIWVLRCERVIQNNDQAFTQLEIVNRWNKTIANRAELDMKMASTFPGKKAPPLPLVISTWEATDIIDLAPLKPSGMDNRSGVLVGSGPETADGIG